MEDLREHVLKINLEPELIISSPLTRALKTTYGAFGAGTESVHLPFLRFLVI